MNEPAATPSPLDELIAEATQDDREAVDFYHFTSLLMRTLDEAGRLRIVEMLWEMVYADGLDLNRARVGIGLSCRLCNRQDCRSRAFPPLEHRLAFDPLTSSATPYRFEPRES